MKFSIIICGYNSASSLGACIEAAIKQNFDKNNYEILYIDNNSTDESLEIAKKYSVIIASELKQGPSEARNKGISMAKGEICLFVDSDAILNPNYLTVCEKIFEEENVGGSIGKILPTKETIISNYSGVSLFEGYPRFNRRMYISACPSCNLVVRKKVLEKVGVFLERLHSGGGITRFSEDKELCNRITKAGFKIVYEPNMSVLHDNPETFEELFFIWVKGAQSRAQMIRLGMKDPFSLLFMFNIPLIYTAALIITLFLHEETFIFLSFFGIFFLLYLMISSCMRTGLFFESLFVKPLLDPLSAIIINIAVLYNRIRYD